MAKAIEIGAAKYVVKIKVAKFQVWESPLNHMSLSATVECKVYRANEADEPEFVYEAQNQAAKQPIGSVMTTSSGFIHNMNKIANEFAAGLSEDILEKLQKKLQPE